MSSSTTFTAAGTPTSISGQLFLYSRGRAAFETNRNATHKCILLGGLSDGFLPTPYTLALAEQLQNISSPWSLVQVILSSSYTGFGHSSLDQDARELEELMDYLSQHHHAQQFALIGHSTGCQQIVHYFLLLLQASSKKTNIHSVFLQAPVSDREHAVDQDPQAVAQYIRRALQEHTDPSTMMPRAAFWAPITAQRYLDLHQKYGKDDYFSSDLTDEELNQRLSHMSQAVTHSIWVVNSGQDEYVPASVSLPAHTERLARAMGPRAYARVLPTGNHNLSLQSSDQQAFVQLVIQELQK